jgi:Na+/H+ antiporter NhaD/arsenite permease-like protein
MCSGISVFSPRRICLCLCFASALFGAHIANSTAMQHNQMAKFFISFYISQKANLTFFLFFFSLFFRKKKMRAANQKQEEKKKTSKSRQHI